MGWLFREERKTPLQVQRILDEQYTYPEHRVLLSRICESVPPHIKEDVTHVYFAAIEYEPQGKHCIFAAVNPIIIDTYEWGYRGDAETVGPRHYNCPLKILDMLTPTDSEFAIQWRATCREYYEREYQLRLARAH